MMTSSTGLQNTAAGMLLPLGSATDPHSAGRKAAHLARLLNAGFDVPDGWVVPANVAERIALDADDELGRTLVSNLPDVPLAVRSSGVDEDADDTSLAGQFESILGVRGPDEILHAIRTVWYSGQQPPAEIVSVNGNHETHPAVPMAILIQPMLSPSAAGVAFSANPVTGAPEETVVNAVHGLGDALMAGTVDPETWIASNGRLTLQGESLGVLTEKQAREVAELARSVANTFGKPQDIEWAIEDDSQFLLQARPITALPKKPDLPPFPPGPWIKETEHFSGIVSVAQASVHGPTLEEATRQVAEELGILAECDRHIDRAGELYMQEVPLDGKHGKAPPGWVLGLLVRMIPSLRARVNKTCQAMNQDIFGQWARAWHGEWKDELRSRAEDLNAVDLSTLSDFQLSIHLREIWDLLIRGRLIHFRLSVPVAYTPWELVRTCRELFGWGDNEAMTLVAATASASSAPSKALKELAEAAKAQPDLAVMLRAPDASLEQIAAISPEFADQVAAYRETFGHRPLDNDFASATLYERADLILGLIREHLDAEHDSGNAAEYLQQRQRAEAERLLSHRSSAERQRFEQVLERAAEFNALREEKVVYTNFYGLAVLRYAYVEAGQRFVSRRMLSKVDDIFYFGFDEVVSALDSDDPGEMKQIVRQRRAERAWTAAHPGPMTVGDPPDLPNISWLPEPARSLYESFMWYVERPPDAGASPDGRRLVGSGVSAGRYRGPVRLIHGEQDFDRLRPGDVLVCPVTTSAWGVLFGTAGALITDHGGLLSHPSIAAREHGIPAVVGTQTATSTLHDGQMVEVDGVTGAVRIIDSG
jgi:rifampicin phosphotransferase